MKKFILPFFCILSLSLSSLKAQDAINFYDISTIQQIKISFEQDDWRYILDSLRYNGDGLLLGTVEINGDKLEDVGIRYRGYRGFTPGSKRNGLYIKLNFIRKTQNYGGYSTFVLSSALRDPSMIREVLGYEIARNYMPAPLANFAQVDINDEAYGLFVNVEPVEDAFLERHFDSSDGSFFLSNPNIKERAPEGCKSGVFGALQYDNSAKCYLQNFEQLSESGWDDLIELTRGLDKGKDDLSKYVNIDRTLWMHAFNNIIVNLNGYSGQYSPNYYLYKDENGQFNPIIWDLNLSFGSFKNTGQGSDLRTNGLIQLDPLLHFENPSKPLISKLLEDDYNLKVYLSHLRTILYEQVESGKLEERAKELQKLIEKAFKEDTNSYYSEEEFMNALDKTIGERSKIPGIVDLMDKRGSFLKKHADLTVIPPTVSEISVMQREKFASTRITEFKIQAKVEKYPKKVHLFYRFEEGEAFKSVSMLDNGKNNDGKANDEIFGVTIKPGSGSEKIQYYIVAENAGAISYNPSNYMYEQHETSLSQLNQ